MKKLKKIYIFFGLFLLIFVSIYSFSIQVFAATNEKTTDGKWTNSHTTENLVALTSDTLTEQGWYRPIPDQVKDQVGKTAGDDHLTSFTDPYGIQARGSSDDIGDKDYSNGVWVRVKLSAADIEKANKGDLTIDASARYYEQLTATHYCSVQIFFEKGSNYAAISNIGTKKKLSKNGEVLTISGKIPAGTTSFRYYVSNWGSLAGKPFIGDLRCSISDRTAAKMTSVTFDNSSITDQENNVAVSGDSLIYDLNFDEKIKSIETTSFYTGIASLMFEGETEPELTASPTLVHENGKSKVRYIFNLQDFYKTGKLYLSSINHLKVLDEGSNTTLVNGDVTSPKIQYYKDMSVKIDVNNLTYRYYNVAKYNKNLTATLISKKGYELPSTITVYAGTTRLKTTQYSYNKVTGDITVYGKAITGDIKIKASGVPKKYNVTFDKKGGINGSDSVITTYSESMPTITVPTKKGYTFLGYYYGENGQGRKYYNADGTSATTFYCYTDITLYAAWEANTYTIIYDKNTPANASNQVMGTMDDSIHTYDISKALSCNLYSLVGYTFKGWATSNNGSVIYSDEESVINLRESGSITLYAVWEANKYEIKYNANKPLGSSGNIFGSMNNSNHTYDVTKNLLDNEYSLVGYTFKGWSKSLNGIVDFKDGEDISNLSSENSDIVNLYAVWEANTYKISYNSNQPLGSSGTITGTMDDSIYKYDEENALDVNSFSLIGYTFKGWAIVKDGVIVYTDKQNVKNLASENNDVVNLYAVWKANKYSIVFNTMGGSFVNKIIITYDEDFSDIVIPSRKGYNFQGYYSLPEGEGTKYYNANGTAIFAKYNDDCDITLYAKWTPIVYNIELYNEGKCVEIIKDVVYGHMRLPSCQDLGIKKANYDFVGWNIYEDQNWSMYNANFDYDSGLGEYEGQSVVLYAAWLEKNIYSINYNANGGIGAPGMMQAHVDETITLTTLIPTRINYKFLGWSTNLNSIVVEYLPGSSFTMGDSPVTLYAIWELNPSLSYNANGGRFLYQAETLYPQEGSSVTITSMIPVLAGYVFIGWNENKDASVATYNSCDTFIMPSTNTVLYAIWKKAEYTITQTVATGYSVSELLLNYQYNDVVTFSVSGINPKVYVNGELITPINGIYSFIITKNSNLIITDGSKISLIYSGNGGINEPVDRNSYDINSNAVISANYPSRIGYHFLGWSTNKESSTPEYYAENIINFESEDIILYAVWEANNYQITYNANGGTGTMLSDLLSYDTTFRLSINTYIKNGYTFLGWSLNPTGEKMFNDGDDVINLSYIQDDEIILYAIWKKTVTEINFVTINGIDTNLPFLIDYGSNLNTDNLTKPSRIGYIFLGYYTETNGAGDLIIDANLKSTLTNGWSLDIESITLYSHWKPITYSIIYMNGQTECNEQIVSYDTNFNLISFKSMGINVPNGYHFAGWSTIPLSKIVAYNDNQNITQALETNDGSKVYLYAVFEINQKYSIIYNANGGINAPIDNNLYYVGDMIIIPNTIPTLEGYKFLGWSYNYKNNPIDFPYVNDKFAISTLSMVEEGITLYAVWKEDKTLQSQIDQVNALIKQLQSSIEGINNINEGFEKNINQLLIEMKQAQDVLNSLDGKYATYEELNKVITKLKNELLTVNVALQDAINAVQSNLDTAITNLNKTIATNKDDIESKLNEVIKAYELADSIINGKIQNLEAKDVELKNLIDSLTKSSKAADTALQDAINTVQSNLDTAITNLNKTIATNKDDIESKLNEVIKAYELADSIINGKIKNLETKDVELKNLIDSLTKSSKDADTALQDAINAVQSNLDTAITNLNKTIATNKDDIESKLNEVIKAYELADSIINGKIKNLETKDNELKNLIDSLTKSSKAADTALQDAINTVQSNLDTAITYLNKIIATNKDDIESKLNEVIKAYELADSIINGKIKNLETKDVELKNLIDSLTKSSKAADTALQDAINTVQSNLDTAITNLNKTIATNKDDIESKLNEVIKAYELADSIINGKIKNLETKDSELQNLIDSLTKSSKAADTALQDAINLVQTNLDNAIASLTDTISTNKDDIESKLNEVIKAYELADSIINGKIKNLETKDSELQNLIDSLTKSSKDADTALQDAINMVQTNLDNAIASLTNTIATNKDDIESKLNEVIKAYELADSIINGKIQNLETKDNELKNLIDSLTKSSKAADTALQDAINTVQSNLDNAISSLTNTIANNKDDIESKLNEVIKAYELADSIINGKIQNLETKDNELKKLIDSLTKSSKDADTALQDAINTVQSNLDTAISSLTNTISNNKDDIESKLNEVIKAYELADSIINGKIQNLETKDNELKKLIDSLTKSSKDADTALQDAINTVQSNLDTAISSLTNTISNNKDDIESKLNEVIKAYELADSIINGKIQSLETKDVELKKLIDSLTKSSKDADTALQDAINTVQSNLDTAITNLNKTIATNKDDIESKLNEVIKAYELADSIINGKIQNLEAKDVELKNLIDSLTKSSKDADAALQDAINAVQSNLDTAIINLNKTIATNKDDIESKLNEVIKAYELADSIINGKIQNLETKDSELQGLIDSLTKSSKDADTALQDAINMVQTNLDNAIASLTDTIATNKDDIESKLNEVIKAYELADSIINGKIQNLESKDVELKNLIDSLTKSSKAADTALQDAINLVQTNLDNAIASLTNTIATNKDDIESKLNEVIKAYELADSIINGKIQSLETKDSELQGLIDSLTKSSKAADTALQDAINAVQSNLDTAISSLTDTIATNKDDIESKLNEVIKAYELADSIINGKIQSLETKDVELKNLIDSLTRSSKAADTALQDAINLVQTNLDNAIASLTDTIANNKDDIESKLNEIIKAYELADSIINGKIQNLEAKDVELKNLVDSLTKSSKAADVALQDAINAVQSNLDTAISSLTDTIANNKDDIESKLNEVIKAYELADSIINGKIQNLETKDVELKNLVDSLTKSSKAADVALQDAINTVQTNLNNAVNDLNLSIANNKQEIKEELITVKKAYEDADIVINSKISSLVEKNEELTNLFNSLQDDLKIAEEKIWKEINKLQDDLDKLKDEMNQKDNELEEMIRSLTETTEKDKNHLYTLNCICLGLIGFVAVVVIFFGLSYLLRTVKKKKLK